MDQAKMQGLQDLLLKFEGRIGPNSLWQGTFVILAVALVLNILGIIIPGIGILGLLLLYPVFCIYAKRFHDAGKPAIWTLAVLGGMLVVSFVVAPMIMLSLIAAGTIGLLIGSFLISAVIYCGAAFVVNQVLKADPGPNAYGEPVADAASPNPLA